MAINPLLPFPEQPEPWLTQQSVHKALLGWHNGGLSDSDISRLYLFRRLDLAAETSEQLTRNTILCQALEELRQLNAEYAEIIQLRFMDNLKAEHVANQLNLATSTFYERQKTAIEQLTVILGMMDLEARKARFEQLESKLLSRNKSKFVGISERTAEISAELNQSKLAWIVSIEGIGGIGKTTLTREAVSHALWHDVSWEDVAWITVRRSGSSGTNGPTPETETISVHEIWEALYRQLIMDGPLPDTLYGDKLLLALESYLRQHKTVVIIDDLETLADIEQLLPVLRRLANPSKFVLTSRQSLFGANEIYHLLMNELSEQDAIQLVREEARGSNLMEVVDASDQALRPIYMTVGGNPLALRLVVGQLHIFDLGQVLDDLKEAQGQNAETLYTYIFRRAWEHLAEPTRLLFIAMLLTTENGDTFDELYALCGETVAQNDLRAGLKALVLLNLVESRGNIFERRYTIHNLTRSFLHKQVRLWQEAV